MRRGGAPTLRYKGLLDAGGVGGVALGFQLGACAGEVLAVLVRHLLYGGAVRRVVLFRRGGINIFVLFIFLLYLKTPLNSRIFSNSTHCIVSYFLSCLYEHVL